MKKSSLVLGVILTHLLAPHSQATNASVPEDKGAGVPSSETDEETLGSRATTVTAVLTDQSKRGYCKKGRKFARSLLRLNDEEVLERLDALTKSDVYPNFFEPPFVTEEKKRRNHVIDWIGLGSCSAHAMAVRTDQNDRGYCNKGPGSVRWPIGIANEEWYVDGYGLVEASPAPAQAMTIESIGLSCSAHAMDECITQSALLLTPTTQSYPMDHEIQQDLHPVARRALGSAPFDAKPEEALRRCITHSVGERHRESAAHLVKLLDRQTLMDIFNMMCVVARNRGGYLQDTDPFAEASVFISRAPMKSIAMKKPRDEDAQ